MKRFFSCSIVFVCATFAFAQLNVNSNGNVAIKTDAVPLSTLSVNYEGASNCEVAIETTKETGVFAHRIQGGYFSSWARGVYGIISPTYGVFNVGVQGQAKSGTLLNGGRSYGVLGIGGDCSSGYNYGVFGTIEGNSYGAGVYGSVSEYGSYVNGRYAGFFNGNVHVTGSISGILLTPSTASLQTRSSLSKEIESNESVIAKLSQLTAVYYSLQQPLATRSSKSGVNSNDTLSQEGFKLSEEEMQVYLKNHYGFVAEELRTVYPDLVYENSQGDLSINYIEMIPLLVQSIKELTSEVESLKTEKSKTRGAEDSYNAGGNPDDMLPELYQNNPNPFSENTEIKYTLPKSVNVASLYIYDMNGKQIDEIALAGRGESSVTIKGNRLAAGIYMYSLIADGKVISVKRMILTK